MKISLLCPSRARPHRLRAMIDSALATAAQPGMIEFLVYVDVDDPCTAEYRALWERYPMVFVIVGPQNSVPALLDELADFARGDLLMAASDDIAFRTNGWDDIARQAFEQYADRILVAYTNDGRDRDKVEHFLVSREWCEAVGCFMYPGFEHFCGDEFVERIGKAVGRTQFLRNLVTEHLHYKYGKADKDETYAAKRRENVSGRDQARLVKLQETFIPGAIERVRQAMHA